MGKVYNQLRIGMETVRERGSMRTRVLKMVFTALMLAMMFSMGATVADAATLVWSDEFSTSVPSASWRVALPWGNTTNPNASELEHYYPANVTSSGGYLNLMTTHAGTDPSYPYESGAITSLNRSKFGYGYFEMRAKLPKTKGIWPALWMIDVECSHEIDILEMLGDNPNKIYMTYHQSGSGEVYQSSYTGPDFSADYHIFAVDWQPTSITWYIDGIQRGRYIGTVKSNPLYICANTAVGGAWPGSPDATTVFPQRYSIDYIRVYDSKPPAEIPTIGSRLTGSGGVATRRRRTVRLSGHLDDASGAPLARQRVNLYRRSGRRWIRAASALTSGNGAYSFRRRMNSHGVYRYQIRFAGMATDTRRYSSASKGYTVRVR